MVCASAKAHTPNKLGCNRGSAGCHPCISHRIQDAPQRSLSGAGRIHAQGRCAAQHVHVLGHRSTRAWSSSTGQADGSPPTECRRLRTTPTGVCMNSTGSTSHTYPLRGLDLGQNRSHGCSRVHRHRSSRRIGGTCRACRPVFLGTVRRRLCAVDSGGLAAETSCLPLTRQPDPRRSVRVLVLADGVHAGVADHAACLGWMWRNRYAEDGKPRRKLFGDTDRPCF
jgi:hypothetical protein